MRRKHAHTGRIIEFSDAYIKLRVQTQIIFTCDRKLACMHVNERINKGVSPLMFRLMKE
jgi:hypothetical protein